MKIRTVVSASFAVIVALAANRSASAQAHAYNARQFLTPGDTDDVVVRDFTHDGHLDVAAVGVPSPLLTFLPGTAIGDFGPASSIALPTQAAAVVAGDFDSDGELDLVVGSSQNEMLYVLLGHGDGSFDAPVSVSTTAPPSIQIRDLATGDFDGDSNLDIAVINRVSNVFVMLGDGLGGFSPSLPSLVDIDFDSSFRARLAIADFDGDGALDIAATTDRTHGRVAIMRGDGAGGLFAPSFLSFGGGSPWEMRALTAADFDGDLDIDLAMAAINPEFLGNSVFYIHGLTGIARNDGSGSFTFSGITPAGVGAIDLTAADFDSDGDTDLVALTYAGTVVVDLDPALDAPIAPDLDVACRSSGFNVSVVDLGHDGQMDLLLGDSTNQMTVVRPSAPLEFRQRHDPALGVRRDMQLADLDGDGDLDLVGADDEVGVVALNDGSGGFASSTSFGSGPLLDVARGDVDGDGDVDVATFAYVDAVVADAVTIWRNDGAGNMTTPTTYGLTGRLSLGTLADLDGDGDLDIAVVREGTNKLYMWLNDGAGNFTGPTIFGTQAPDTTDLALVDLNHDGFTDVVMVYGIAGFFGVRYGNAPAGFGAETQYVTTVSPLRVVTGDFDGDSDLDLATLIHGSSAMPYAVQLWMQQPSGAFVISESLPTVYKPIALRVHDVDQDGNLDVLVTTEDGAIALYQGDGAGGLSFLGSFGCGDEPQSFVVGDLDGDAFPDLAASDAYGLRVLFHLGPEAPLVYCTAKTNSQGCVPSISASGSASATSASPFTIGATQVLNNKNGLLFYGYAPLAAPFQGGTKCVSSPTLRTPVQGSGGNPPPDDCSGAFAYDFNARIQSGVDPALVPATYIYAQYWSRDPAAPFTTGLSNGVSFQIGP